MADSILLVGAGGHCKSCIDVIESDGRYSIRGVVGLPREVGTYILDYPILGVDKDIPMLLQSSQAAMISVGQIKSATTRINLYERLIAVQALMPVIKSPQAIVSRHAVILPGTMVMHGSTVNAGAFIGSNVILNTHSLVEHDCRVGNHCHISTGAILNGGVAVGDGSFIGSGAIVHQGISIGCHAVVGAGVAIRENVPDHATVVGEVR